MIRAIRGAITVKANTSAGITGAVMRLLKEMSEVNRVKPEDIISVIFSSTKDLNAEFPAKGARLMGWGDVPLFCAQELDIKKSVRKCVRVLMHVDTKKSRDKIRHIYLEGAKELRKEFSQ